MIVCKEFPERVFGSKQEMFDALRANKSTLIAHKKMATKYADAVVYSSAPSTVSGEVIKADSVDLTSVNKISLKLVINTTNIMDSHSDVHLKGIWKKSVKENKNMFLLQEHKMSFSHIISDDIKASVQTMKWSDLGESYKGDTEALIFETTIDKRNEFMFNQYAKSYVKNHSVGMRYVKMDLAINSDSKYDVEEKEIWDKYIDEVANKEDAEAQGYFWVVSEAKAIEGSAVPIGSNRVTPTISAESKDIEPSNDTQSTKQEAVADTSRSNFYKHLNIQ